jgi:hypothetical protein
MKEDPTYYNEVVRNLINSSAPAKRVFFSIFLNMNAVKQMMRYIYHICQRQIIDRKTIYSQFFKTPFVQQFCDREGIKEATEEAAKRRCPFLLNILDACGIVESSRSQITVKRLLLTPDLVKSVETEDDAIAKARLASLKTAWPTNADSLAPQDLSILRENFGPKFLTDEYFLNNLEIFGV